MSPLVVSGIVFAIVIAGALLGLLVRIRFPEHQMSPDSKDVIKLAMGVLGTMTALSKPRSSRRDVGDLAPHGSPLVGLRTALASGRAGRMRRLIPAPVGKHRRAKV
jgi:hypothetical protein